MAFVNRAVRPLNISKKESNEVGPGHYFTEASNVIEMTKNAPFNTSTSRPNYYKGTENSMGPGSYETTSFGHELVHNSKPINTSLYKAVEANVLPFYLVKSIEDSKKIGFSTKTQRFGETKQQIEDKSLPGPGQYQISTSLKRPNPKKTKASSNSKTSSLTCRPTSISTIPSKEMYGYEFKDGVPVLIPNPYKEENEERANLHDLSPKWSKNSLNWNRMSMNNQQWMVNQDNASSINSTLSNENLLHNKAVSDNNTEASSRSIIFKTIMDKRNNLYQPHLINNPNSIADFVFNSSPGPGYYTQGDSMNKEGGPLRRRQLQSFGSTSPRFASQKYNDNYQLYIENNKPKPKRFLPKVKHIFTEEELLAKKESFLAKALFKPKTECNVGPGSYDVSKSLIRKDNSSVEEFGTRERRFNEDKETSPGPGSYISLNEEDIADKHQKIPKMIPTQTSSSLPKEVIAQASLKKDNPPIGLYNPSIISTINYKVLSKINQFQDNKLIAFGAQEKRFLNKQGRNAGCSLSTMGPGLYFNSKPLSHLKNNSVSFNHGAPRFNYKIKGTNAPSPGTYEVSSFHDWNKKSHNILFI